VTAALGGWIRLLKDALLPARDRRPLGSLRYVVLDTEFTSLDPRTNRLLSFGAVAMQGSRILLGEQIYRVVNPGVEVPAAGILVHGLRPEDISQASPLQDVLAELHTFVGSSIVVGHFVKLDLRVLRKESRSLGLAWPVSAVDTARAHAWLMRRQPWQEHSSEHLENLDLPSLARHYQIDPGDLHHALGDAFLTARVWQKMLSPLQQFGINCLGDLSRIAGL